MLERCAALRGLLADRFPMIIVDEFQDTDDNQWRIVRALAKVIDVFCLADPEQRIFDYAMTSIPPAGNSARDYSDCGIRSWQRKPQKSERGYPPVRGLGFAQSKSAAGNA